MADCRADSVIEPVSRETASVDLCVSRETDLSDFRLSAFAPKR